MCCFSGPGEDVAATRIFARMSRPGWQVLAYQRMFASRSPVAMILPVPTPPGSAEELGATRGRAQPHPMAFELPTRDTERLYFPTLHVHDGTLPTEAVFDHARYAQGLANHRRFEHSRRRVGYLSHALASKIVDVRDVALGENPR